MLFVRLRDGLCMVQTFLSAAEKTADRSACPTSHSCGRNARRVLIWQNNSLSFIGMGAKDESRRDCLMLQAINPADGKLCTVQISKGTMTVMSNEEFARRMMLLARPADQFEP